MRLLCAREGARAKGFFLRKGESFYETPIPGGRSAPCVSSGATFLQQLGASGLADEPQKTAAAAHSAQAQAIIKNTTRKSRSLPPGFSRSSGFTPLRHAHEKPARYAAGRGDMCVQTGGASVTGWP